MDFLADQKCSHGIYGRCFYCYAEEEKAKEAELANLKSLLSWWLTVAQAEGIDGELVNKTEDALGEEDK